MKRLLLMLVLAICAWIIFRVTRQPPKSASITPAPETNAGALTTVSTPSQSSPAHAPLLGETILRDYANTNRPPENDLTLMSRLMDNALLLLKSAANRPLSANEDWADLLRGKNGAAERFLPDSHPALNSKGQLVDRWGTPLFFHALGAGRYEIRTAGPDRKLWTPDDLQRNADGSFHRGADLNAPSR